eukprot:scaffold157030_cov22-Tisochrysis_lutea.AAC.2
MLGAAEAGGAGCSTAGGTSPTANARGSGANFAGAGAIGGSTAEGYGSTQGFGRIGFDPTLGEERLQEMVSLQLAGLGRSLAHGCLHEHRWRECPVRFGGCGMSRELQLSGHG